MLCVVFLTILNCRNSADQENITDEDLYVIDYSPNYMNYGNIDPILGDNIKIEYQNARISKRIGDVIYNQNMPYGNTILNIYDEVTYSLNEININKKSSPGILIPSYQKKILLSDNKISQIIIKTNKDNIIIDDTLKFNYNGSNISNLITYNKGIKSKSWFYFNSSGNLDSIVTKYGNINFISLTNYSYNFNETTKKRKVEVFLNYDNYANPLKNLIIFDETFTRALSKNNYKSYRENNYNESNVQISNAGKNWTLIYENNKVNFSR